MKPNISILWDIENVTPSADSLFIEGLIDYSNNIGHISSAIAIGDWHATFKNRLAVNLSEKGFELIHIPQPDDKGKRKKNSADFVLIAKATEMIFQYPHIRTYILLTGDIDFRPLLQTLKKHGKRIIIICDSNTASENLLEFADEYTDYRNLTPDNDTDTDNNTDIINGVTDVESTFNKEDAFPLLVEAVATMLNKKKIPTPGSIKVRMQLLNDNFTGDIEGFEHWNQFINEAKKQQFITTSITSKGITLALPKAVKVQSPKIIKSVVQVINELAPKKQWAHFSQVSEALMKKGIDIKKHKYSKLKKLILDAEKRDLVDTRNEGVRWFVRIKN